MVDASRIEDIFKQLGNPGRYHVTLYVLLNLYNFYCLTNYIVVPNMSGIRPEHSCTSSTSYISDFQQKFDRNITTEDLVFSSCWVTLRNSSNRIPCRGWTYEKIDGEPVESLVTQTIHIPLHTLLFEMTRQSHNIIVSVLLIVFALSALLFGSFVGWLLKNWWKTQLVLTVPILLATAIAYFFLPESYKWLVVHHKEKELQNYLETAARFNGIDVPVTNKSVTMIDDDDENNDDNENNIIDADYKTPAPKKKKYSFIQILRHRELRKRLFLGCCISFASTIGFFTLQMNISSLSSHPYKVTLLSSAFDVIPVLLCYPLLLRFGKRRLACAAFGISGVFSIAYKIYNHTAVMIIGKMFLMLAYSLGFLLNVDIFPTVVRNTCSALTVGMGQLGGILAPLFVLLGTYTAPDYPVLIGGILALISSICTFFLPDMTNQNQPNTFQDLDEFTKNKKNKKKKKETEKDLPLMT